MAVDSPSAEPATGARCEGRIELLRAAAPPPAVRGVHVFFFVSLRMNRCMHFGSSTAGRRAREQWISVVAPVVAPVAAVKAAVKAAVAAVAVAVAAAAAAAAGEGAEQVVRFRAP